MMRQPYISTSCMYGEFRQVVDDAPLSNNFSCVHDEVHSKADRANKKTAFQITNSRITLYSDTMTASRSGLNTPRHIPREPSTHHGEVVQIVDP